MMKKVVNKTIISFIKGKINKNKIYQFLLLYLKKLR